MLVGACCGAAAVAASAAAVSTSVEVPRFDRGYIVLIERGAPAEAGALINAHAAETWGATGDAGPLLHRCGVKRFDFFSAAPTSPIALRHRLEI